MPLEIDQIQQKFIYKDFGIMNISDSIEDNFFLNEHDFMNHSLSSTIDPLLRNNSSKSLICCPYNSSLDGRSIQIEEGFEVLPPGSMMKLVGKPDLANQKY